MPTPLIPNSSEVARRIGVSREAVSRYRAGQRVPRSKHRQIIAAVFGWTLGEQAEAEAAGKWSEGFNKALLTERYGTRR